MNTLFKHRNFSDFFTDTIAFFKENWNIFFRNYLIINGAFLMTLMILIYIVTKVFFESLFGSINNPKQASIFSDLMQDNALLFVAITVVFILIIILISVLSYAYPIIYMDLYEKNRGYKISTSQIIQELKKNAGRLFMFFLGSLFVVLPLAIIIFGICALLCFILIGFPMLFIFGPTFISWYCICFFDYLTNKVSFFESLSSGYKLVKSQFWAIVGGTFLAIMVVQILQSIVVMVPYLGGLAYFFASTEEFNGLQSTESFSFMTILVAVVFILSLLISYLLNNFLIVSQGMMYYSARELTENKQANSQIDNIGSDFE